jgi:hydrogenase nickel incorporation protein HypB
MPTERVELLQSVMKANDEAAARIRNALERNGTLVLNFISAPGSGKTTLLARTLERVRDRLRVAVVAGDVQTQRDAERLARYGVPVQAIETGGSCHLDARHVSRALEGLPLAGLDLLLIENVGNLVCPAAYDLGETWKVVLVSVAEGEDKPLKYPAAFRTAGALVVTKIDLAPYVGVSAARIVQNARSIRPDLRAFPVSAYTGEGLEDWVGWLVREAGARRARAAHAAGAGAPD